MKTKSGVSRLLEDTEDPGSLKFSDKEKANLLQQKFWSVFTKENTNFPEMEKRTNKSLNNLIILEAMVRKEILALNINKSCSPDEISLFLLINL